MIRQVTFGFLISALVVNSRGSWSAVRSQLVIVSLRFVSIREWRQCSVLFTSCWRL